MHDLLDVMGRPRKISNEFGAFIRVVGNSKIFPVIFEPSNSNKKRERYDDLKSGP